MDLKPNMVIVVAVLSAVLVWTGGSVSARPELKPMTIRSLDKNPSQIIKSIADRYIRTPSSRENPLGMPGMPVWSYPTGVTLWAMMELSDLTGEDKYRNYVRSCFDHCLRNNLIPEDGLDQTGSMMHAALELHRRLPNPELMARIDRTVSYFKNDAPRLPDGTFCYELEPEKGRIWVDAMFMVCPLLVKYASMAGDPSLYDEAARQLLSISSRLMDPEKKLFHQGWGWGINPTTHSPGFFSRGNGWMLMAMNLVLENLPLDHPKRKVLADTYKAFLMSLIDYQDTSGLWHLLIDRQDTYEETSGSAMFIYCTSRAVGNGWIDKKHADVIGWGLDGIRFVVDPDGVIWGTCIGTGCQNTLEDYYARPAPVNDHHGMGPVMLALIEAVKLEKNR